MKNPATTTHPSGNERAGAPPPPPPTFRGVNRVQPFPYSAERRGHRIRVGLDHTGIRRKDHHRPGADRPFLKEDSRQ